MTRAREEQGMALIGVLLLLVLLSALCATLAVSGQTEILASSNQENGAQARAAAEAGLNHAVALIVNQVQAAAGGGSASPAMTAVLRGPDGLFGTPLTDADNGLNSMGFAGALALNGIPGVSYTAIVFDDDGDTNGDGVVDLGANDIARIQENALPFTDQNQRIVVRATGTGRNNTTATLEAIIGTMPFPAIVTNGDLTVSGNARVTGANGSVHANGDLTLDNSVSISQNATASGDVDDAGAMVGGYTAEGQTPLTVPPISAVTYRPQADYILTDTGTIVQQNPLAPVITVAQSGWSFGGGTWSFNGNSGTEATYYVEGDVHIAGSPGTNGNPFNMSIIATGSIEVAGNGDFEPEADSDLLFVTDKDLKMTGSFETDNDIHAEGIILVHEQIYIAGTPDIAGQILVENAASTSSLVTDNTITGNALVTHNGFSSFGVLVVSGWREVR